ncbi:MAG: kelch repeat-containing protein [Planctomycetota bacterium]
MTRRTRWIGAVVAAVAAAGCSSDGGRAAYTSVGLGGSVTSGGSLLEGRDGHAVAALDSGLLLVVGGRTESAAASATLERYDPQQGWSDPLVARLDTARVGHQAVRLPDGRVWILGGADAQGHPLDSTELFDPRTETLSAGPLLQTPRAFDAAAIESTTLVLAGGTSASVEVWDLAGLAPISSAPLTLPRAPLRASLARLGAGWILAGGRDERGEEVPALWIDLVAGQAEVALEPLVTRAPAVALPDGSHTFLVAGRLERPSPAFQRVLPGEFEPVFDDRYRVLEVRDYPSVVATDDGVLVVGGVAVAGPAQPLDRVEWVGPEGSRAVDALIVARRDAVLTPLADGRIVISGGSGVGGRPVSVVEVFAPGGAPGADRYAAASRRAAVEAQRQRDLAQAQAEVQRLQQDLAQTQARLSQVQADVAAKDAQVQSLSAQATQLGQQLAQLQQQAQAAAGQNSNLQSQIADLSFRLGSANRQRDMAIRERDDARAQQALLAKEVQLARDQVKAAEDRARQAQEAAARAQAQAQATIAAFTSKK